MFKKIAYSALLTTLAYAGSTASANACPPKAYGTTVQVSRSSSERVIYKLVQPTAQYDLRRPEVVSGTRVTLFANFLRNEPGIVTFNLAGTSVECKLVEWKPNSVTIELPRLGLLEPKNAEVQIVLPDGRIAKTFPVLYVSQPDIVIHEDTIPQAMPPAPAAQGGVYAMPVRGGMILQSSE